MLHIFIYVHIVYPNGRSEQSEIVSICFHIPLRATEICVANNVQFPQQRQLLRLFCTLHFCEAIGNYCKNLFNSRMLRMLTELAVSLSGKCTRWRRVRIAWVGCSVARSENSRILIKYLLNRLRHRHATRLFILYRFFYRTLLATLVDWQLWIEKYYQYIEKFLSYVIYFRKFLSCDLFAPTPVVLRN